MAHLIRDTKRIKQLPPQKAIARLNLLPPPKVIPPININLLTQQMFRETKTEKLSEAQKQPLRSRKRQDILREDQGMLLTI